MKALVKTSKNCCRDLCPPLQSHQWPIVYRSDYNISLLGIEKLHPFDSRKWGRVFKFLKKQGIVNEESVVKPNKARDPDLLLAHSSAYLNTLKWSCTIARITEICPLCLLPNIILKKNYLSPIRYQTGGSVLAGKIALDTGWAINLGGGFHHCSKERGGGFCPYADISLLIIYLLKYDAQRVSKVMIVDLDAHQGNGYARDFMGKQNIYIMDVYNKHIYPKDSAAKAAIRRKVELEHFTSDNEYLEYVESNLEAALREFHPDILVYNAGTDILDGDRLGLLSISPQGIIRRDELVFMKARERRVPIVMLTSGGYLRKTARIIADSIINLHEVGLISGPTERE